MESTIVKIGNSQCLIFPKKLLSTFGSIRHVDIQSLNGELIIRPIKQIKARENWENIFSEAVSKGFIPESNMLDFENIFDQEGFCG